MGIGVEGNKEEREKGEEKEAHRKIYIESSRSRSRAHRTPGKKFKYSIEVYYTSILQVRHYLLSSDLYEDFGEKTEVWN